MWIVFNTSFARNADMFGTFQVFISKTNESSVTIVFSYSGHSGK